MVSRVRAALNVRFPGSSCPNVLFTDRGNGFYSSCTGAITEGYRQALRDNGLRAFFSREASLQPGQLQEVLLHETAVSWLRDRLSKTLPHKAWEETVDQYRARLKHCASYINKHFDVDALCHALPDRLEELRRRQGDRLTH